MFTAEKGDLTLTVTLGRKVDGKYRAMSDIAAVGAFTAPGDLRALDQTYEEYTTVLKDITDGVKEVAHIATYRDSKFSTKALSSWDNAEELKNNDAVKGANIKLKMVAYLNNQLPDNQD